MHRRVFLERLGAASATGMLARLPIGRWTAPLAEYFPEPDEAAMRALALQAIDAARAAGADFADARLAVTRRGSTGVWYTPREGEPLMAFPQAGLSTGYGVRAIVDGAWGFASATSLTPDSVVRAARDAVAAARANRRMRPGRLELAAVPGNVTGAWDTPIERDPLSVPFSEQGQLALDAAGVLTRFSEITEIQVALSWRRSLSIFAATDGRVFVQRLTLGQPAVMVKASVGPAFTDEVSQMLDTLPQGGYGYEAAKATTLVGEMEPLGKRTIELARAARTAASADVGRYDLVFAPPAVASLLDTTLAPAVNLPVALGYSADWLRSFAAPPMDVLGRYQVASPLLTLRADRTRPNGGCSVKWDAEGVETEAYTCVKEGTIVDYHTDRQTSVELGDWYRRRDTPVRSHGCARFVGTIAPAVQTPNLTLVPGRDAAGVDDLIADTARGFYIEGAGGASDQQLVTAQFNAPHFVVREIRRGKLGGYVKDLGFQFMTAAFWKSVDRVGGASAARVIPFLNNMQELSDDLQMFPISTYEVVPVRARNVNVFNTGRTA